MSFTVVFSMKSYMILYLNHHKTVLQSSTKRTENIKQLTVGMGVLNYTGSGQLEVRFYGRSCTEATEEVVRRNGSSRRLSAEPSMLAPAKLLLMQFHDCFVRGCVDTSILLDVNNNMTSTEKESPINALISGFDVIIDEAKEILEQRCPGIVSCADILALVTGDAVSQQIGMPIRKVRTGRRDGLLSNGSEVFARKGLPLGDMVVLSGAHTIGVASCNVFSRRLQPLDPTLDAHLGGNTEGVVPESHG